MAETTKDNFSDAIKEIDADSIKCPGCGSNMAFDPASQMLLCPHCDTKKSFASSVAKELDLSDGVLSGREWPADEAVVFRCDNCGAKVVLDSTETAKSCPFCGTAHVRRVEEFAGIKPSAVVPFTLTCDNAVSVTRQWAKRKLFAPKKFKKNLKAEDLKGIYAPCFTFDSKTESYYKGVIGETRTRVVGSGKNRRVETYTVWRNISGIYHDSFDDVTIAAGTKLDQKQLNKISPFDTNRSKSYEKNYMLGFMAYRYDRELEDCWQAAKKDIDRAITHGILSNYVYDKVSYLNVSTTHSDVTYKHVMLPVYVGNFRYNKKSYNFFVNGSSGKVYGKTPKSVWKILCAVAIGVATVVGVALLSLI